MGTVLGIFIIIHEECHSYMDDKVKLFVKLFWFYKFSHDVLIINACANSTLCLPMFVLKLGKGQWLHLGADTQNNLWRPIAKVNLFKRHCGIMKQL